MLATRALITLGNLSNFSCLAGDENLRECLLQALRLKVIKPCGCPILLRKTMPTQLFIFAVFLLGLLVGPQLATAQFRPRTAALPSDSSRNSSRRCSSTRHDQPLRWQSFVRLGSDSRRLLDR